MVGHIYYISCKLSVQTSNCVLDKKYVYIFLYYKILEIWLSDGKRLSLLFK